MTDNDNPPPSAESAAAAAEAVRTLYSTRSDLRYPSDVDVVLGSLTQLVERLPQTSQQLARFLDGQLADGVIRHDEGTVAASKAIAVARRALLDEAVPSAQQLLAALGRAQQAVSGLSYAGSSAGPSSIGSTAR